MKREISLETSQKLKNMSLLCALLIVSMHVSWSKTTSLSVGWFIQEIVATGVAKIAVPFFFIVSGFFLARHFDEQGWWNREVKKRIRSLVIPFFAWIVINFFATTLLSIIADRIASRPFGTNLRLVGNWLYALGLDFADYAPLTLWYVRCVFVFALLGVIFKYGVWCLGYVWLALTFLVYVISPYIENEVIMNVLTHGGPALGAFYFSIGVFIQRKEFIDKPRLFCSSVCAIFGLMLLAVKVVFAYNGGGYYMMVATPLLMYAAWNLMPTSKLPSWLTACSFPIYVMHMLVILYMEIILKRCPWGVLTNAFIIFFGSIVSSIAITLLLRRFMPKVAAVLFGGR